MRVVYGVHGYGRGHATRSSAVLAELSRHHQVLVLAGGDAYPSLSPDFPVVAIPTFGFAYAPRTGQRSNYWTVRRNFPGMLDLKLRGPVFDMVRKIVEDFAPDVVISDAEAWTHHVAAFLRIPRIAFDHIGLLLYCRANIAWEDRFEAMVDASIYRMLVGNPDRVLVSSFYHVEPRSSKVQVVPALARKAVRDLVPTHGDHLVAYFNRGCDQLNGRIFEELANTGCPVHLYGSTRRGREGNLHFRPLSGLPFLEDLASCRAVLSTAGNQLVGEAIHLGKPLVVIPERCVEQRLNADAVARLGLGERLSWRQLKAGRIRDFLDRCDDYRTRLRSHARDGVRESLEALRRFFSELAPGLANPPLTDPVGREWIGAAS